MLRAIIVDDEELSVKRLKKILSDNDLIDIRETFQNPLDAYEYAKNNKIDLAFLDISMPEINGMKLSSLLRESYRELDIVFVTGFDEYAVQAFDMSALDYLMKPVSALRMSKTLDKLRARHRIEKATPSLAVQLFNGLKIYWKGQEEQSIKLRSPKTEELFAFLIFKGTVSREEIIDTLWRELEHEKALKNLNSTLYYIRKAIGTSEVGECIQAGRNEIRIDKSVVSCDLYEFEQVMKQIRLQPYARADLLERIEVLYTGPFLNGKAYEWASEKTRRLEQEYISLLEVAARSHLNQNQLHKSLHYFLEILRVDGLREDISHEIILLYIELGRKNDAIRQYRLLEETLQQELGTQPDPYIQDVMMSLTK
ncbi:response regulator [Brevibacillus reuszeri]|uniref:response regulator n=1 Tax=Brevibacillus reuszeri TaxID=54915 RepID=UPI000CCBE53F|nr:response regulator [Brevibacillus reuszeri]